MQSPLQEGGNLFYKTYPKDQERLKERMKAAVTAK